MGDVLAIDIGGSHVKVRIESDPERRRFESGPDMTAVEMVEGVKKIITDWDIDRVAMGVPAPIRNNTALVDPVNLGDGWAGFDFTDAFGVPTKLTNDAAMQAIGSYDGGADVVPWSRNRSGHLSDQQVRRSTDRDRAHALQAGKDLRRRGR